MLRKVFRYKKCGGWIIPDIEKSMNVMTVGKCQKCDNTEYGIY